MKENKKYKLIKTYPGYEILGAMAYQSGEYYYVVNPDKSIGENYIKQLPKVIENNPEYWEWIVTENKLLNKYLEATKKPFADIGSMYDIDTAEECVKVADEFAIGFAIWCDALQEKLPYLGIYEFNLQFGDKTVKELLEIYKEEKGL